MWTPTVAGTWTVTAFWSGDAQHSQPESDSVVVIVNGGSSTLTLTGAPSNPLVNQPVTLTATLNHQVSDGTVTFTGTGPNGASFLPAQNSCTPSFGVCTVQWTPQTVGSWSITANWSGDAQFAGAQSTVQVRVQSGFVSVTANPNPATVAQQDRLTATLAQTLSTGQITFSGTGPNGQTLAHLFCTPSGGACSVTWTPGVAGTWHIVASWSGDSTHGQQTGALDLQVQPSLLTLIVRPDAVAPATNATVTAQFSDVNINSGQVSIVFHAPDSTLQIQTCTPVTGACAVTWTPQMRGQWTVAASWPGDATHPNGASATVQILVS
jgi:hypothetical protein